MILELGGGDGRLAKIILRNYKKEAAYTLLEYNDKALSEAKENLKKPLKNQIAQVVKTDIVEDSIFYLDENKTEPIQEETVDIVLGSGILTVVSLKDKDAALSVLQKVYRYLKPDGYLVLSGHAYSFLNSKDFIDTGFEVINTSLPKFHREFYVVKKLNKNLIGS